MKDKLRTFGIFFVGNFLLSYLISSDRNIWGMLFVSAGVALIAALIEKRATRIFQNVLEKILKRILH